MGLFSDIPVRANGEDVDAAWWNTIRSKLILYAGTATTSVTQQSVTDGQSATAITSFSVDKTVIVYARAEVTSKRNDGTNERRHVQFIELLYNSKRDLWTITTEEVGESCTSGACSAAASGLTYSVNSSGQVFVAADTMGGSHSGTIRWKIVSTIDKET